LPLAYLSADLRKTISGVLSLVLLYSSITLGDQFHYKDILVGERASGLGGAFVAISDDPSGVFYNPAGTIFGLEDYLSLSANAFISSQQTYKDIYPEQDYNYTSSGLVPVFFGFTQTFGKDKIGFAVLVPNSDLIDQKDTVTNAGNRAFRRKFFLQDATVYMGPRSGKSNSPFGGRHVLHPTF